MGIAKELLKRARLLEAQQEKKASRLEREAETEAEGCEDVASEKLSAAKEARSAQERALQFNPRLGRELICTDCAVLRDTVSPLKPSDRTFVATGDDSLDVFRCSSCGFEISISA